MFSYQDSIGVRPGTTKPLLLCCSVRHAVAPFLPDTEKYKDNRMLQEERARILRSYARDIPSDYLDELNTPSIVNDDWKGLAGSTHLFSNLIIGAISIF